MHIPTPRDYFSGKISHGFVSLYTGKVLMGISGALLGLFLPIFLYELFNKNFAYTALYFGIGYLAYAICLFFFVRFLNSFGFRKALRVSILFGTGYYATFYFLNEINWHFLLPLLLVILTIDRILYWLPYHVDFAKFTSKRNRSKQLGALGATRQIAGIFIPLLSGFIISKYGFDVVFIIAAILYLSSGIPYLTLPRTREKFSWNYIETLQNLVSKKYRKQMLAFASDGAETGIAMIVWPIFMYQILNGDYLKVGAISTIIIGISVTTQLILGKKLDKKTSKRKTLKLASYFSAVGWIIKVFIATTFQIFIVGAFHNLIRIFTRMPFDALTYEIAADEGHYVDEFTVLHEIAISIGRIITISLAIVISIFANIGWVFLLAAIASILLNFLRPSPEDISS
ncbi:MFS transporter [Patescibacteria group bacterium]